MRVSTRRCFRRARDTPAPHDCTSAYSTFMDRACIVGWKRAGYSSRRMSEAATIGLGRPDRRMLALALPHFAKPPNDDWLTEVRSRCRSSTATAIRSAAAASSTTTRSRWRLPGQSDQGDGASARTAASTNISASTCRHRARCITNTQAGGVRQGGSSISAAAREEPVPQRTSAPSSAR